MSPVPLPFYSNNCFTISKTYSVPGIVLGITHFCDAGISHLVQKRKQTLEGVSHFLQVTEYIRTITDSGALALNLYIALSCQGLISDMLPTCAYFRPQVPDASFLPEVTQITFGRSYCQELKWLLLFLFLLNQCPTKIAQVGGRKFFSQALSSSAHTCPRGII